MCWPAVTASIPILLLLLPDHRGEHQDVRDEALFILLNNIFLLAFVVYAFGVNYWYCRVSLYFCTIHTFICLNLTMPDFFVQTQQQFGGRWWRLKMMFLSRTIQQQGHCLYFLSSLFYQCELFYGPKYLLVEKDAKFGCLSSSNPRLSSSFYKKSFCSD